VLTQSLNPVTRLLYATSMLSAYEVRMIVRPRHSLSLLRAGAAPALLALGIGLSGCAEMGDGMSTAFADPAKYELYDCKQLEPVRKSLATRGAELQGLMAKAQTGVAGPVVAELAYRNEYISVRGQAKFADEAWRRNKCQDSPPAPAAAAPIAAPAPAVSDKPGRSRRSGSAVN
jgi:hypothetical protein